MTRPEAIRRLRPFFTFLRSLPAAVTVSVPLLREFAALGTDAVPAGAQEAGVLKRRIHRRYLRLCRLQEELGALDLQKAKPGVTPEDFIFSRIDFSRYRDMDKQYFDTMFPEGLSDFDEALFRDKFGLGKEELRSVIEECYAAEEGRYRLCRENSLILSIMRTLEISLEDSSLFTGEETGAELKTLAARTGKPVPAAETLFPLLAARLDNTLIAHTDGMTTRLFISAEGDLSGTFTPGSKPWTRILIPAGQIARAGPCYAGTPPPN